MPSLSLQALLKKNPLERKYESKRKFFSRDGIPHGTGWALKCKGLKNTTGTSSCDKIPIHFPATVVSVPCQVTVIVVAHSGFPLRVILSEPGSFMIGCCQLFKVEPHPGSLAYFPYVLRKTPDRLPETVLSHRCRQLVFGFLVLRLFSFTALAPKSFPGLK